MTTIQKLIKVWDYKIHKNIQYNLIQNLIPQIWQLILISDGSFTRNISIITNINTTINLIQEKPLYEEYRNKETNDLTLTLNRTVWLINDGQKVVFAQSSWQTQNNILSSFSREKPLGKKLITSEINIHRKLESIYLCYSTKLEQYFQCYGPLWGRCYQINLDKKSTITIHEIFAFNNQKLIPSKKFQ